MTLLIVNPWKYSVHFSGAPDPWKSGALINGALPGPYVPVRVTRGALLAHWYTYAPLSCRTSQYRMTFVLLSVSFWNDLSDPVSRVGVSSL